jgi:hypothetical protein
MDLVNWLPSITTTSLLALALWLSRKLVETRLVASVEHEFNTRLEALRAEVRAKEEILRADLRSKESEIAALRSGAMTAMASRQMALDRRKLEAVDQLWSAVTALGPARAMSAFIAAVNFEVAAKEAENNPKVREMFTMISAGFDPEKIDSSGSAKARPFVSPMTWALFRAYQTIVMTAVVKLQIMKTGVGAKLLNKGHISELIKAALPHQTGFVDKFGDTGYHYLLEELEERLLDEMRKMLAGIEADKASIVQAAEILRLSNNVMDSVKQSDVPPNIRSQGTPPPNMRSQGTPD